MSQGEHEQQNFYTYILFPLAYAKARQEIFIISIQIPDVLLFVAIMPYIFEFS